MAPPMTPSRKPIRNPPKLDSTSEATEKTRVATAGEGAVVRGQPQGEAKDDQEDAHQQAGDTGDALVDHERERGERDGEDLHPGEEGP